MAGVFDSPVLEPVTVNLELLEVETDVETEVVDILVTDWLDVV